MRKSNLVMFISGMLFSLSACSKATPEDGTNISSYSSLAPLMFVGSVVLIFSLCAFIGIYIIKKTPEHKHNFWFKIFTFLGTVVFTACIFPFDIVRTIEDFSSIFNFSIGIWVIYSICSNSIKIYSTQKDRLIMLFGGSALGVLAKYLLEFGEVSNTVNFTTRNLITFFIIIFIIYLLTNRKDH